MYLFKVKKFIAIDWFQKRIKESSCLILNETLKRFATMQNNTILLTKLFFLLVNTINFVKIMFMLSVYLL